MQPRTPRTLAYQRLIFSSSFGDNGWQLAGLGLDQSAGPVAHAASSIICTAVRSTCFPASRRRYTSRSRRKRPGSRVGPGPLPATDLWAYILGPLDTCANSEGTRPVSAFPFLPPRHSSLATTNQSSTRPEAPALLAGRRAQRINAGASLLSLPPIGERYQTILLPPFLLYLLVGFNPRAEIPCDPHRRSRIRKESVVRSGFLARSIGSPVLFPPLRFRLQILAVSSVRLVASTVTISSMRMRWQREHSISTDYSVTSARAPIFCPRSYLSWA
jgi:hypothetical protein